jgi:Ca2+-binding RTX toxin-like protein
MTSSVRRATPFAPRAALPAIMALVALMGWRPVSARAVGGFLWTFPGNCNGTTTLQDCIDQAHAGDTIQIATDEPIDEGARIVKSLVLEAAQGFHPTIALGGSVEASSGTIAVSLRNLTFGDKLNVMFTGGSGHSLVLAGVSVARESTSPGDALLFDTQVPASIDVSGGTFRTRGAQSAPIAAVASDTGGDVSVRLVGNVVSGHDNPDGGPGISLSTSGTGALHADVFNNSVFDSARCGCGTASGLALVAGGTARVDLNVVGNTFDTSKGGLVQVENSVDAPGHVDVDLFDNVLSHASFRAVAIGSDNPSTLDLRAGHNDFFSNGAPSDFGGHSGGAGNLHKDPRYVDRFDGNLRLQTSSPVVDTGFVCTPGGVAILDAAGHTRLAGSGVDMGAFELGAGPPSGQAFVGGPGQDTLTGTPGADILCGYGGNDVLHGKSGDDYLDGGGGGDGMTGGIGADTVHGRSGDDGTAGGSGADLLFGEGGADELLGQKGPDILLGGPGPDPCLDALDGVQGNDRVVGGPGSDGFAADPGDDVRSVEHGAFCN